MSAGTAICTWFVADDSSNATYSPQLGMLSDVPEVQHTYWRCITVFFASSLAVNPDARHMFFSNVKPPRIDGTDLNDLFESWGIEVVRLPITWRLSPDKVSAWANQFYIFEILHHFALNPVVERVLVLDNDCIWLKSVAEMEAEIDSHGALTYLLDDHPYRPDTPINGLTQEGMERFIARHGAPGTSVPYCGGEFFAARIERAARMAQRMQVLWPEIAEQAPDAPTEDGHMFSVLYALEGIAIGTANRFIRRLWTTFHFSNLSARDDGLTIWHLPAEKKTGFAALYKRLMANPALHPSRDAAAMGLTFANYARAMGWPRRRPVKLVRDLSLKLAEKLRK